MTRARAPGAFLPLIKTSYKALALDNDCRIHNYSKTVRAGAVRRIIPMEAMVREDKTRKGLRCPPGAALQVRRAHGG